MLLKVGDLAKRCGLTVRMLHHYDSIGLLTPSARSDSGYRLYDKADIARLHQVQALRRFGMSLADIGAFLANPDVPLTTIVERQIAMLDQQITQASVLRDRLSRLHDQLVRQEEPELAEWLTTLEWMTMYDKYLSQEERARAERLDADVLRGEKWAALVATVREAMARKLPSRSAEAQALAKRWVALLAQDTALDPVLTGKLHKMHINEPALQERTGISLEMLAFIMEAINETKLTIYAKYLSPQELQYMRENFSKRGNEWPGLIADVRQHMSKGTAPDAPEMQKLAQLWIELFRSGVGDDPQTQAKVRLAMEREPELSSSPWMGPDLIAYVRESMAGLQPA
ncbi:MerR family transcriptional regulator [Ralstonia sp. UBA689]|uniref:MerR family transcriptional regulator n=1 Tax=Ralstonia sp. UBA689 TaxID=1947373 RepID=UPI0025D10895|nr:MerR family transcriptional regulator [Ralstonia sp. UBA689]